mmetsp:Transcript_22232/g.58898  ORF Transcript_22232/g.58898 Transcript_22232/m.58898 type:complete len:390 (-) Transcript_22232:220-1389(-)
MVVVAQPSKEAFDHSRIAGRKQPIRHQRGFIEILRAKPCAPLRQVTANCAQIHLVFREILRDEGETRGRDPNRFLVVVLPNFLRVTVVEHVGPQKHLGILVQKSTCGLYRKGLHARPRKTGETDLLAKKTLRIDKDQAFRCEEDHVAGSLEGHLAGLAALKERNLLVKLPVLLHGVQHAHVSSEPRPPTATLVHESGTAKGIRCKRRGVLSQEFVGEIPLNGHDVSAGAAQVELELVLRHVVDARPELQLRVSVEVARRLHRKGLDGAPHVAHVLNLRARQPLDVDVEHASGGQHRRVSTALESHVHGFVRQEYRRIRPQLRLHDLGINGPCVAHEDVREGRGPSVHANELRRHIDLGVLRVKDVPVDELLQCEYVNTTIFFERHHMAR